MACCSGCKDGHGCEDTFREVVTAFGHLDMEDQAKIACMDKGSVSAQRACQDEFRAFALKNQAAFFAARMRRFEEVYQQGARSKTTLGEQIEAASKGDNLAVVARGYLEYAAGRMAFARWEQALRGAVGRGDIFELKDPHNPVQGFYSKSFTVLTDEEMLEAMGVRGWEALDTQTRRLILKNSYATPPQSQSTGQDPWDNFFGEAISGVSVFASMLGSGPASGGFKKLKVKGLDARQQRELIARLPVAALTLEQATVEGLRLVVDAMDGHTGLDARRVRATRRHNEYNVYIQMRNHLRRQIAGACPGEGGGIDQACALRYAGEMLGGELDDRLDFRRGEFGGAVDQNPYQSVRGPFDASDPGWVELIVQGEQIPTVVGVTHPGQPQEAPAQEEVPQDEPQEAPAPSLADRIKAIFGLGVTKPARGPLDLSGEPGVSSQPSAQQPMALMRASAPMKISKDDRKALAALDAATRATVQEQKGWLERQYDDLTWWVGSGRAQDGAAQQFAAQQRSDVETALLASQMGTEQGAGAGAAQAQSGAPATSPAPKGGKPRSAPASSAPAAPDLSALKAKWEEAHAACRKAQAGGLAASFVPLAGAIYQYVTNDQLELACKEAETLRSQYIAALRQVDPKAELPQETGLLGGLLGGGGSGPQEKSWIAMAMEQFFDSLALQAIVGALAAVIVAAGGAYLLSSLASTAGQTAVAVAPHAGEILRGASELVPAGKAIHEGGALLSMLGGAR